MNPPRRKWLLLLLSLLLAAGLFCLGPRVSWEVRATLWVRGEGAGTVPELLESPFFSRHLREISDFDGSISASAIPGTQLVELTLRDDSEAHAQAGMEAALRRLPAVMAYFAEDFSMEILLGPRLLSRTDGPDPIPWLLAGAAILLLILPAPKFRKELDLPVLLRQFARLTRRYRVLALTVCLAAALGFAAYRQATYVPNFQASVLVSVGDYTPETAAQLPSILRGLLQSDLLTRHLPQGCLVSPEAAADSNLFTLTAAGPTPEAARQALDTILDHWPALSPYADQDLTLTLHQTDPAGETPTNPFQPAAALGQGLLLGLAAWTVFGFGAILFRQNIDTAPCKAYNESQS